MQILLAEADRAARHTLEAALTQWGYEVVVALDGDGAWSALSGPGAPRLALVSSGLAGLSTADVCQKARDLALPPYLVLLAGRAHPQDAVSGLAAGADDFLYAPYDEHEIQSRLRAARRILDLQQRVEDARAAFQFEAQHDALTALFNRSAVLDALRHELARSMRERTPVGVVVVDVDGLRAINEAHGHGAGDAVLREIARRLTALVRPYDSLGRYGAGEFLVVLPGCDIVRCASMGERIRTAVAQAPITFPEKPLNVTASIGAVASGNTSAAPEVLVSQAEAAAHEASAAGGNGLRLVGAETR